MSRDTQKASCLRYLDGTLPEKDVSELNEILSTNPAFRRELANLLLQQVHLLEIGQSREQLVHNAETVESLDKIIALVPKFVWRPYFLAAAAALAILLTLFTATFFSRAPRIETFVGAETSLQRGAKTIPIKAGLALKEGDILRTAPTNRVIITYRRENTRIVVGGASRIQIRSWGSGKAFGLLEGRIDATVAHQANGAPMTLETSASRATVVGTEFNLAASTNTSRLDVLEGAVDFTSLRDGKLLRVNGSHYAEVSPGLSFEARDIPHGYGSVLRETWLRIENVHIRNLTESPRYPLSPDFRDFPSSFSVPTNWPGNCGVRLRAFLRVPLTGDYYFWITGGDAAELWLGVNELPESEQLISSLNQGTAGQWDLFPWQKSAPVRLIAGRKYYLEALFKKESASFEERTGVAWQPPGAQRELIPSNFLSAF